MKPLILGHRGASARAPENTIEAMRLAIREGADGVEYDVQLSRDGHSVVFHDEDLERITGIRGTVRSLSLTELERLRAGSHSTIASRIPRLTGFLERLPCVHDLEIKLPEEPIPEDYRTALVLECVRRFASAARRGLLHPASVLTSFDRPSLDLVSRLDPVVRFGVLIEDSRSWDALRGWSPTRCPAVLALDSSLAPLLLDAPESRPQVVRDAELWFWNVPESTPGSLLGWNPRCLIVNDPGRVRALLGG